MVTNKHLKRCFSFLTIGTYTWDIPTYLIEWLFRKKKSENIKNWQGCGPVGSLLHCWWECKMQLLWKTVWQVFFCCCCKLTCMMAQLLIFRYLPKIDEHVFIQKSKLESYSSVMHISPKQETTRRLLCSPGIRLRDSIADRVGSIPGKRIKIP